VSIDRIYNDPEHRDDLYALNRDGCGVAVSGAKRMGRVDRAHIFQDGTGEIIPASKLRSKDAFFGLSGRSFKQGTPHSHDLAHQDHYYESIDPQDDLLKRFRRESRRFREERWESRD